MTSIIIGIILFCTYLFIAGCVSGYLLTTDERHSFTKGLFWPFIVLGWCVRDAHYWCCRRIANYGSLSCLVQYVILRRWNRLSHDQLTYMAYADFTHCGKFTVWVNQIIIKLNTPK
jgi:hypothetical protein